MTRPGLGQRIVRELTGRIQVTPHVRLDYFVANVAILARSTRQRLLLSLADDGYEATGRVQLGARVSRWHDGTDTVDVEVTATADAMPVDRGPGGRSLGYSHREQPATANRRYAGYYLPLLYQANYELDEAALAALPHGSIIVLVYDQGEPAGEAWQCDTRGGETWWVGRCDLIPAAALALRPGRRFLVWTPGLPARSG